MVSMHALLFAFVVIFCSFARVDAQEVAEFVDISAEEGRDFSEGPVSDAIGPMNAFFKAPADFVPPDPNSPQNDLSGPSEKQLMDDATGTENDFEAGSHDHDGEFIAKSPQDMALGGHGMQSPTSSPSSNLPRKKSKKTEEEKKKEKEKIKLEKKKKAAKDSLRQAPPYAAIQTASPLPKSLGVPPSIKLIPPQDCFQVPEAEEE